MSRTDRIVAFPAFYRGGPCSSRFTPGFVAFRLRTRDTTRFKKGSIDLTSVQYLICDVADDDVKFSIVQAKDLVAGMSASRRMENRHVVLCAGPDAWRDIGDLKSWSDEVDRAGLTDAMTAALAHLVVSPPAVDGGPPSVEVTRAFDADAFETTVDAVVPFSIVPPRPAFCATAIPAGKYDGAKFSPEAIGMAPVTVEQRLALAASRKRKSSDDRAAPSPKRPAREGEQQPPALDVSLEELLGLVDADADEDARRAAEDDAALLAELLADEDDCALPPLPAAGSQRVEDLSDLDDIYAAMHANS